MELNNFFSKDQIIFLQETEKQLMFKEMLEKLQELGLIENKERYYAQVIHRESLDNTGIGNGFAIPHVRTETVPKFISIFGISKEGINYSSYDDKPVNYILLSIFPTESSTKYLYLIGMMARIFSNNEKVNHFVEQGTTDKIYNLLKTETESYFESISDKENVEFSIDSNLSGVPSSDLDLIIRLDRLYKLTQKGEDSEDILKKVVALKKLIDNRSLTYYERMRKKRNSPFAIVEKTSCSGCNLEIPPMDIQQIRERKGLPVCTHCGRFLILI